MSICSDSAQTGNAAFQREQDAAVSQASHYFLFSCSLYVFFLLKDKKKTEQMYFSSVIGKAEFIHGENSKVSFSGKLKVEGFFCPYDADNLW